MLLTLSHAAAQSADHAPQAADQRVESLLTKLTLDEKIELIAGDTPFRTHAVPRLGIPFLQMADGPVGAHIPAPTIAYAAGIGLAASWDQDLAIRTGEELGRDSRSRGAVFLLGPGVNIYRAPMNGRNFEYFGEDPYLASRIAVGYITGVQHEGVSATVKHFLGNNSEYLRHDSDSVIDERTLREIYMPTFEAAVKEAHVGAIMDSYNLTNGEHMTQNRYLNQQVAKGQWHFPGIIMSDWVATYDATAAFKSGMDLEMPFGAFFNKETLVPLLRSGAITQAELDDKVRRILRTAARFGWLDHPALDTSIPRFNMQGRAVSLEAATEGAVLLQNQANALPLDRSTIHTIAVIGPTATQTVTTGGGSGEVVSFGTTNLLVGISEYLGEGTKVLYARGLHSINQMAALTRFSTSADGKTRGITHVTFEQADLKGRETATTVEPTLVVAGSSRREPEIQELNALTTHRDQSPYTRTTTSSKWTGFLTAEQPGDYAVFAQTDGRYRLLVDGAIVFDSSVIPKAVLNQAILKLTAGPHKVEMEQLSTQFASVSGMRVGIAPLASIVEPDALEMASKADAVVLAVGFNASSEAEGGDRGFDLPPGQQQLIEQVAAKAKKTVVLITSGGSVNVAPWRDRVRGIFATWYAGELGGKAAARLLFGEANPSGHLPITWEKNAADNPSLAHYYPDPGTNKIFYREGIFMGYRGYEHSHTQPLYPFGYGLSYTTFALRNLEAGKVHEGHVSVSFDIQNTGARAGATVAQLYVNEVSPSVSRPAKELKQFARVELKPGETKHVTLELNPRSFSFYDVASKSWHADAGAYQLMLGQSSAEIEQTTTLRLDQAISTPVDQ